jgi:hypothetical protein
MDSYRLREIKGITTWNFISCLKPQISTNGFITLTANGKYKTDRVLLLRFPNADFSVKIEEIVLAPSDGYQWGSNLYRIVFIPNLLNFNARYRFVIQVEGE